MPANDRTAIANAIRDRVSRLADERGMTLEELATRTGVPVSLLVSPNLSQLYGEDLVMLACVLDVPITSLFSH